MGGPAHAPAYPPKPPRHLYEASKTASHKFKTGGLGGQALVPQFLLLTSNHLKPGGIRTAR